MNKISETDKYKFIMEVASTPLINLVCENIDLKLKNNTVLEEISLMKN